MTRRVGVIEWVENAAPLKEVIEEQWASQRVISVTFDYLFSERAAINR